MSNGRRGTVVIAVAGVVLLAGAAVLWVATRDDDNSSTSRSAQTRGVVMFVGDSNIALGGKWPVYDLTNGDGELLHADHLDNNYVPVFVARSGAGIRTKDCGQRQELTCTTFDFWKQKLPGVLGKIQPDAVVINLGINDADLAGSATTQGYANYGEKIDWFMKLMPPDVPVFWTNLPCAIEPQTALAGCPEINNSLAAAQSRWPDLVVIDWEKVAGANHDYMDSSMPLGLRVHYSDAGFAAWAQLVTQNVDAKLPAP